MTWPVIARFRSMHRAILQRPNMILRHVRPTCKKQIFGFQRIYAQQCHDERREAGERNEVEGKFGTCKRCYGLDRLTTRLQATCETQIHMIILTMNLWKKMKASFASFLNWLFLQRFWNTSSWSSVLPGL